MNLKEQVAANLRKFRLRSGLSQSQFAERVHKSVRYISALENQAQNVTLETLATLAEGLGCSAEDLVGSQNQNPSIPSQIEKAKSDFEKALTLLHKYQVTMERQVLPPKRSKKRK